MKTVFFTGIAGFLGRHLATHFKDAGWRVAGVDYLAPENVPHGEGLIYRQMKLPSPELAQFIRELSPDVCVHCAGRASVPLSMEDPAADFRDNTVLTFEVLDALRVNVPKCTFILLSSAAVYGNPAALPISENQHVAPLSPYGFHKRQCELLCQEFARVYGMSTLSARIFSAYGSGLRRQVIWDICERLRKTGVLSLKGTGQESRDFIHANDIARAILVLSEKAPASGEIYNLATGHETTIAGLAESLIRIMGLKVSAAFDGSFRLGDPLNWRADISKISALGFTPSISLEQGITQFAAWHRADSDIS